MQVNGRCGWMRRKGEMGRRETNKGGEEKEEEARSKKLC